MVKVSVVIPVYNVEDFLGECLDSITNQTLKDIEIICVNDGSTDKSLEILNEYAKNDDRFTIISQENGGHAVATNKGMELAQGEYLYLMDSDDILKLNALEDTVKIADEKNVDFVIFQAINYYMEEDVYLEKENYSMNKLADHVGDNVFSWKDIKEFVFTIAVTPWSKIYRRDFVVECGARFPEGLVFDDNVFFWEVLFSAERIAFYRQHLFIRRWYSTSSTTAGDRRFIDMLDIYDLIWDVFKRFDVFEEFKLKLYQKKVNTAYTRFKNIKPEFKQEYFEAMKDNFLDLKNDPIFDDFYMNINEKGKVIFDSATNSLSSDEFTLKIKNYELATQNKRLASKNKKLNKKIKKYEKLNNKLLNSKSWKLTNPLRNIVNFRKK